MTHPKVSPPPDWSAVFGRCPELEPPGYREACHAQQQAKDNPKPKPKRKR